MSKYVVVAIDWTGRSEREGAGESLKPFKPKCPPDCQTHVSSYAAISFSQLLGNCEITTKADLSQPKLVVSMPFDALDKAKQWVADYKHFFDFVQVLELQAG